MRLRGQLLRAQFVGLYNLLGQNARRIEPVGVEGYLADHRIVRHHHSHRAEQNLQVIRQLCASGVAVNGKRGR